MLTRQGTLGLVAGAISLVVGRVFGIAELFVIGTGFLAAVGVGWLLARFGAPRLAASRSVRPTMLVARDVGRVDLRLHYLRRVRSGGFTLIETVRQPSGEASLARLNVASLPGRATTTAGYRLPTARRGIVTVGPLVAESTDPLGAARHRRLVAPEERVVVAPRAYLLPMPQLGQGVLGRQLLAQARRLGPGEFHSLREYAPGDEPRSIHWRASARSDDLLVKQHTTEGLQRLTVVLDTQRASYPDEDAFERAVTVAASLVHSAANVSLVSRFVTVGVDLRGPEMASRARTVLAEIQAGAEALDALERDPADGLGLAIVITGASSSGGWRGAQGLADPTTALLFVYTAESGRGTDSVSAPSDEEFVNAWRVLVGRTGSVAAESATTRTTPGGAK